MDRPVEKIEYRISTTIAENCSAEQAYQIGKYSDTAFSEYLGHRADYFNQRSDEEHYIHPKKIRVNVNNKSTPKAGLIDKKFDKVKVKQFRQGLARCLDLEEVEAGVKSAAEYFIEKWLKEDPLFVQMEFGKFALENTENSSRLVGLLHIIAHADRKALNPTNELIVMSSFAHKSTEVKEFAIGVYEYWGDAELVKKLKDYELQPQWLDDYRKEVIADFCGD